MIKRILKGLLFIIIIVGVCIAVETGARMISTVFTKSKKIYVRRIEGENFYKYPEAKKWKVLTSKTMLPEDVKIKTSYGAEVDVSIGNKGVVRLKEETCGVFGKIDKKNNEFYDNTKFNLIKGSVLIKFENKKKEKEIFRVLTPSAVAEIRGTSFSVDVYGKKNTSIFLDKGKISVKSISKKIKPLLIDKTSRINITLDDIKFDKISDAEKDIAEELEKIKTGFSLSLLKKSFNESKILELLTKSNTKFKLDEQVKMPLLKFEMGNIKDSLMTYGYATSKFPETLSKLGLKTRTGEDDYSDPWEKPYRYRKLSRNKCELTSSGPDKKFDTSDDVKIVIKGDF